MGKKKSVTSGLNDERFSRIRSDPMFAGLKNSEKKVVIDKRFAAALTDERFSTRAKVDMRGRKQKKTVGNNMLDLYELEEDEKAKKKDEDKELDDFFDEDGDDDDEAVEDDENADDEEDSENDDEEEEEEEEEDEKVGINGFKKLDLARGEGNVESSSDDDSSDEEEDDDEDGDVKTEGIELDLANLDRDVDQVEWTSRRLAVCNLEWDNMNCEDILMLVKSFTPQGGNVVSIGVYLSDFGKEELEKEEKTGPSLQLAKPIEEYKEEEMDDETRTAVREYLVKKLKYYYAVITFDSIESAVAVYSECDGFQFEETGLKMDMRFIPDDMEFEEDRVKEFLNAEDVNLTKYKARKKSKSAIISTGAKIAWDEDDPQRKKKFLEAFNGDEEAGKDLIVDSDESDDDEDKKNRDTLMALLHTDERQSKLNIEWDGEEKGEDSDDSSDGEYVKVDDDDDEIGVKPKTKKRDSDDEDEEEEEKPEESEKLSGYKAYKKKQKAKLMENKLKRKNISGGKAEENIKTAAAADSISKDDRFSALFTDSAFAIEPSSKKFKGSLLVTKQAEQKSKGAEQKAPSKPEDLVQKLKAQADKWNKKKTKKN